MLIMSVRGGFTTAIKNKRARNLKMDETVIQNALAGTLEEEGAENHWLSELGWASYLDKQGQSYAMNERASVAGDGYFTPDAFSNPLDVLGSWAESMKRVASDPMSVAFPTITNDMSGNRSYGKGNTEYNARTLQYDKYYYESINSGENFFNLFGSKYDPTQELREKSKKAPVRAPAKVSSASSDSGPSVFDKIKGLLNKDE